MRNVNIELIKVALEKVGGDQFEQFANSAFADLVGPDFIPLGGRKDWGADAVLSAVTYSKRPHIFYQFSVEENFRDKIRKTIARLREVERDVKTLYYATSQIIPRLDVVESELGEELKVILRIRDGLYLATQVNSSPAMLAAYDTYLAPAVSYLSDLTKAPLLGEDDASANSAVYVFLCNELDSRTQGGPAEGVTDALIIWALRDTGSTEDMFMTADAILAQIEKDVPGAMQAFGRAIPGRLQALSKIPQAEQRPIRYHSKANKYCIAFDLRSRMRDENLQAEALRKAVFDIYRQRIAKHRPDATPTFIEAVSRIALRAIQRCLQNEGIEFAAFLCGKSDNTVSLKQSIDESLLEEGASRAEHSKLDDAVKVVLAAALSKPATEERTLYSRIASVYTMLFCLRTEPRLIQYFQRMAGHFHFLVGADVLVHALAERFGLEEQNLLTNTLRLARAAGATLTLTEPVLEEVQHHLFAADQEFQNYYRECEEAITPETVDEVNRPLIRAYFYGKFSADKNRPRNWAQFLNNYCDPHAIRTNAGKTQLRKYLMAKLGMDYEDRSSIERTCDSNKVARLAERLAPHKRRTELARNDALLAYAVYSKRKAGKEAEDLSGYGLRTWWLTNELTITSLTKSLVQVEGASYLMRPDFLLNFLSFLPKKQNARALFETLFPSLLGVHLAREHSPAHVERLHQYLQEIKAVEPARRRLLVAEKSDALKADLREASWYNSSNPAQKSKSIMC